MMPNDGKQAPMLVYTECFVRSAIGVFECVDKFDKIC